jgi:hypothetical protein
MGCDLIGTILVTPNCLVGSTPLATARVFAGHASVTVPECGINDAILLMMRRVSACHEWCDRSGEHEVGETSRVAVDRYTCGSDNDPGRPRYFPILPETPCTTHSSSAAVRTYSRHQVGSEALRKPCNWELNIEKYCNLSVALVIAAPAMLPLTAPHSAAWAANLGAFPILHTSFQATSSIHGPPSSRTDLLHARWHKPPHTQRFGEVHPCDGQARYVLGASTNTMHGCRTFVIADPDLKSLHDHVNHVYYHLHIRAF